MDKRYWIGKYAIIRGANSGAQFGQIVSIEENRIDLTCSRRLWQWQGAASLSQLAMQGTSKPNECKFPCIVTRQCVLDAIEILECTEEAVKSIMAVPVWKE